MFGYIVMNQPEIKFKDYYTYRSFYCGLCRELRERYGISGQISLTYDMTFVTMLLSGLYEPPTRKGTTRCVVHPLCRQTIRKNAMTEYAADMNIILTYYKCMDDWKDEHKYLRLAYARLLERKNQSLQEAYRKKIAFIVKSLDELSALEKKGETDLDRMAGLFGNIMAEILTVKEDQWEQSLRRMGFFLGKYIYILDAYEDVEKDAENGSYNPFLNKYKKPEFQEEICQILMMMLAEVCREFEKLPIIKYTDILRNILYSGVWTRFQTVSRKRREDKENSAAKPHIWRKTC